MRLSFFILTLIFATSVFGSPQKVTFGKYETRGLLNLAAGPALRPLVILVPGSGAQGPEVMFPGKIPLGDGKERQLTTDGIDHSIFAGFTEPLNQSGVSTLAIGKPGVDFFTGWTKDHGVSYYDEKLFGGLQWSDLVENVHQAVLYARKLPGIDPRRIYVLGHSESTQVVADYAVSDPSLAGVILFGVVNSNFADADAYQVFDDYVDNFVAYSVDANKDGFIDRSEAARWPDDFQWKWKDSQDRVSIKEISTARHADPELQASYLRRGQFTLRTPVYHRPQTLAELLTPLKIPIYVYNGNLDVMTVQQAAIDFRKTCEVEKKFDCFVTVVPDLGHGFSAPIGPRAQPYLDFSFGPVDPRFQKILSELALKL